MKRAGDVKIMKKVVSLCTGVGDWSDQIIILRKLESPQPEGLSLGVFNSRIWLIFYFLIFDILVMPRYPSAGSDCPYQVSGPLQSEPPAQTRDS